MSKENFQKALEFLFPSEGGYVNHKKDKGGATNLGVTQWIFDAYNKKNKLPQKNIKNITREEAEQIYYDEYWIPSGADKITDPNMAVALFDTAVLHGPSKAKSFYKQSGGDLDKFLSIRRKSYDQIVAKDPSQKAFYKGWNNRLTNLENQIKEGTFEEILIAREDIDLNSLLEENLLDGLKSIQKVKENPYYQLYKDTAPVPKTLPEKFRGLWKS